jgi:predicted lipid-binding transport protein (Tim44 family)
VQSLAALGKVDTGKPRQLPSLNPILFAAIAYIKASISVKGDLGRIGPWNGPGSLRVLLVQALQLLIFAVLAGVVLYQLYNVLGRRVGRQPGEDAQSAQERPAPTPLLEPEAVEAATGLTGLAALRAREPSFDVAHFLSGARSAYEMIVRAFAAGDRDVLRGLLAADVFASFDKAIGQKIAEGRTETVEFIQTPRADLEGIDLVGDQVRARVRFLAEFRSRTKGPEGEGVDDRRTAEVWTFARPVASANPNWTLMRVDAAQA